MFNPKVLNPEPDPYYVREVRRIDPDLRIVWGFARYFMNKWVVERHTPPERYFAMYASLLSGNESRFVEQPIFDTNQHIYDAYGEEVGYVQVGHRTFDLAPEYEWVTSADALDSRLILELKRAYAWDRNHSLSRLKFESEQEAAAKTKEAKAKRTEAAFEGIDEALLETRARVQFGHGDTRNE